MVGAVDELVARHTPEQMLAEAILRYEGEGYRTTRLEAALSRPLTPARAEELVKEIAGDLERLDAINAAIRALDRTAPELARVDVLLDPDRVADAEQLLERVRERVGGPAAAASRNGMASLHGRRAQAGPVAPRERMGDVRDPWFLSRDKVLWSWPHLEDWIVRELD
jgi:hypothetical protein